jgi:hypothetical protein
VRRPHKMGPCVPRVSKMEQISAFPRCDADLSWGSAVLQLRIVVRLNFALIHRLHGIWNPLLRGHRLGSMFLGRLMVVASEQGSEHSSFTSKWSGRRPFVSAVKRGDSDD